MNERDPMTSPADARFRIDQLGSVLSEVSQGGFDVSDLKRNVVKTLAMTFKKPSHWRIPVKRLQQLHMGATNRNHRLLHTLRLDDLAI